MAPLKKEKTNRKSSKGSKRLPSADVAAIDINDKEWQCMVAFFIPTTVNFKLYLRFMIDSAQNGLRRSIRCISLTDVLRSVRQQRPDGPGRATSSSWILEQSYQNECIEADSIMKGNREYDILPTLSLARLIKFQILKLKHEDLKRRELITEEEQLKQDIMDRLMSPPFASGSSSASSKSKARDKSDDKGKSKSAKSKSDKSDAKKSKGKKKNGKESNVKQAKPLTLLRKRGEECLNCGFIEDAPEEGPDIYVILAEFTDPDLPLALLQLGVPLKCIINFPPPGKEIEPEGDLLSGITSLSSVTSHIQVNNLRQNVLWPSREEMFDKTKADSSVVRDLTLENAKITSFWKRFSMAYTNPNNLFEFRDCAMVVFEPKYNASYLNEDKDVEKKHQYIYDEVSNLLYDLQDLYRQGRHYVRNMDVQKLGEKEDFLRTNVYETLLEGVPGECITVSLLMHCILEQVRALCKDGISATLISTVSSGEEFAPLADHIKETLSFTFSKLHKSYGLEDAPATNTETLLVLNGDNVLLNTYHCSFFRMDPHKVTLALMMLSPFAQLWQKYPEQHPLVTLSYYNHMEKLAFFLPFKRIPWQSVKAMLYVIILKQLNRQWSMPDDLIEDTNSTLLGRQTQSLSNFNNFDYIPLARTRTLSMSVELLLPYKHSFEKRHHSDTYIHTLSKNIKIKSLVHCAELLELIDLKDLLLFENLGIEKFTARSSFYDGYDLIEEMTNSVLLQAILSASQTYSVFRYKYFAPTDSIILVFYYPINMYGIHIRRFSASLPTPVDFRGFYGYIRHEQADWLKKEELAYKMRMRILKSTKDGVYDYNKENFQFPAHLLAESFEPCLDTGSFSEPDFYITDTIKYNKYFGVGQKSDGDRDPKTEMGKGKRKRSKSASKKTDKILKEDKKSGEKKKATKKLKKEDDLSGSQRPASPSELSKESQKNNLPFLGYDLGPLRIEYSGSITDFHSVDNCVSHFMATEWLDNCRMLTLQQAFCTYELHMHVPQWPIAEPISELLFHVSAKSGAILAFSITKRAESVEETTNQKERRMPVFSDESVTLETKSFRDQHSTPSLGTLSEEILPNLECTLSLSLPTGLHMTMINLPDGTSYVKQTNMSKGPECTSIKEELYRCYLPTGNILRFLRDGSVEILCPDGTMYTCREFSWDSSVVQRTDNNVRFESTGSSIHSSYLNLGTNQKYIPIDYTMISADGRTFEVMGQIKREISSRIKSRVFTDYLKGVRYTRRHDGLNFVLYFDGSLAVGFPDQSVIVTTPFVEEEEVYADEELHKSSGDATESGFISVKLHYKLEHPNHVTVIYRGNNTPAEIKMPQDLTVRLQDNSYTVEDLCMRLDVSPICVSLHHDGGCEHVIDLRGISEALQVQNIQKNPPPFLCKIKDTSGREFLLDYYGRALMLPVRLKPSQKTGESPWLNPYKRRCFILNRDLSGWELLHRRVFRRYVSEIKGDDIEVMVRADYNQDPVLYNYIVMVPKLESCSQSWLMPVTQICLNFEDKQNDKVSTLPSTYVNPPSWTHPFPLMKNLLKLEHEEEDENVKTEGPDVLVLRAIKEVVPDCVKTVSTVKAAIIEYKEKKAGHKELTEPRMLTDSPVVGRPSQARSCRVSRSKHYVCSSPTALLVYGHAIAQKRSNREQRLQEDKMETAKHMVNHVLALTRREHREKEIYKNKMALRYRIVPPYFSEPQGKAFLVLQNALDNVAAEVEARNPHPVSEVSQSQAAIGRQHKWKKGVQNTQSMTNVPCSKLHRNW